MLGLINDHLSRFGFGVVKGGSRPWMQFAAPIFSYIRFSPADLNPEVRHPVSLAYLKSFIFEMMGSGVTHCEIITHRVFSLNFWHLRA